MAKIINPFSHAQIDIDCTEYTLQQALDMIASRMSDDEGYACEMASGTNADWIANMVAVLGARRAGELILS